jgi:hypothetical protein
MNITNSLARTYCRLFFFFSFLGINTLLSLIIKRGLKLVFGSLGFKPDAVTVTLLANKSE